jgi:hypothetical protein
MMMRCIFSFSLFIFICLFGCQEPKKPFPVHKINVRQTTLQFTTFYIKELHKLNAFPKDYPIDTNTKIGILDANKYITYELKEMVYPKVFSMVLDSVYRYGRNCLFGDTLNLAVTYNGRSHNSGLDYTFFTKVNDTWFNEINFSYYWNGKKEHSTSICGQSGKFVDLGFPYVYFYYTGLEKSNFVKEKRKNEHTLGFGDYQAYFRFVRLPNDSVKLDDMALYLY